MEKGIFLGIVLSLVGCGYSLQNSHNPLGEKEGIRKIYIAPIKNNSYKAGIESIIYNNLIRTLLAYGRVKVVSSETDADAVLTSTIDAADYGGSLSTDVRSNLNPKGLGASLPTAGASVFTEYTASLGCSFVLARTQKLPGKNANIWTGGFSRNKLFAASNQMDVPGTTSVLINDSEFYRAVGDMARSMMDDMHESMLAMF